MKPLEKISDSIKSLVNQGTWCCYKTKQGEFIIGTTPYSWCCNPHGKQIIYTCDEDGSNIRETGKELKDFEIEHPVSFPDYVDPSVEIFRRFNKDFGGR